MTCKFYKHNIIYSSLLMSVYHSGWQLQVSNIHASMNYLELGRNWLLQEEPIIPQVKNATFRIFFRSLKLKLDTRQEIQVKECWEGKAKGLMQVLWGRWLFIDGKNLPYYDDTTLTRRQDAHKIVNLDSSLRHIMSMFTDILKESKGMGQAGS